MTRTLAITKRQAESLMKAATKQECVVEVKTPIGVVRLIPAVLADREPKVDAEPDGHL